MSQGRLRREVRTWLSVNFGKSAPLYILAGLVFLAVLSWAFDTLGAAIDGFLPAGWRVGAAVLVLGLIVALAWLFRGSPKRFRIHQAGFPQRVRGLVLFVSWPSGRPGPASTEGNTLFAPGTRLCGEPSPLHSLTGDSPFRSWRMPLEAIRYHMPVLEHVALVASADSRPGAQDGSFRHLGVFEEVVHLFEECGSLATHAVGREGVDYEDLVALDAATAAALDRLEEQGLSRHEIVVAITSGKATCSAVGALRSHDEDLSFQYVSVTDNEVRIRGYDVVPDLAE